MAVRTDAVAVLVVLPTDVGMPPADEAEGCLQISAIADDLCCGEGPDLFEELPHRGVLPAGELEYLRNRGYL